MRFGLDRRQETARQNCVHNNSTSWIHDKSFASVANAKKLWGTEVCRHGPEVRRQVYTLFLVHAFTQQTTFASSYSVRTCGDINHLKNRLVFRTVSRLLDKNTRRVTRVFHTPVYEVSHDERLCRILHSLRQPLGNLILSCLVLSRAV